MKRKGFTLIELLAVIVVLAIIALIATPIVMNVIKNAQKGATERSAERYLDAVETAIATDMLTNQRIADGTYTVDGEGNLSLDGKTLIVEVNGNKPKANSTVAIEDGQVVSTGTNLDFGDYTVTIDSKGSATATEKGAVVAEVLCTAIAPTSLQVYNDDWNGQDVIGMLISKNVGTQATAESPYALGAVYSCDLGDGAKTFYVLKTDGDNVKLIMNRNLVENVKWCTTGSYDSCTDGAETTLVNSTSGWTKLASVGGTVGLPVAQDIADVNVDTGWNVNVAETSVTGPDIFRTYLEPESGPYGYWTSTIVPMQEGVFTTYVWGVNYKGGLIKNMSSTESGIRPVITIPKSNMSL